jgi:hypothetical protein
MMGDVGNAAEIGDALLRRGWGGESEDRVGGCGAALTIAALVVGASRESGEGGGAAGGRRGAIAASVLGRSSEEGADDDGVRTREEGDTCE